MLAKGSLNTLKLHLFSHLREWGVREVRIKATLFLCLSSIPLPFFWLTRTGKGREIGRPVEGGLQFACSAGIPLAGKRRNPQRVAGA